MSIIQQAMARAQQEREGASADNGAPTDTRQHENQTKWRPEVLPSPAIGSAETAVQHPDAGILERNRILTGLDDQDFLDAYSLLRTRILHATRDMGWNSLMITSPGPGDGKTTTAINLGISMARDAQQTALVVDTNLRTPRVQSLLELEAQQGLTDYLLDDVPVPQLLIKPGIDKFVVMPGGRPFSSSTEVLGSPKMKQLVQELKNRYPDRYVLFDCPHLLKMPDALVFSNYVDGVVLVVRSDKTSRADIQASLELLKERNLIGMVMNSVQ